MTETHGKGDDKPPVGDIVTRKHLFENKSAKVGEISGNSVDITLIGNGNGSGVALKHGVITKLDKGEKKGIAVTRIV